MNRQLRKVLAVILAIGMLMSTFTVLGMAADADVQTWTRVDLSEITAEDKVAITMTYTDGTTWVLPADTKTNKGISAIVVTVDGDTLTSDSGNYGWTFTSTDGGYYITNAEGKYLYVINDNNGVRVNTTPCVWSLDATGHYLAGADTNGTTRYLGVYRSTPDWRAYTNTTNNTKGQTVGFWKLNTEEEAKTGIVTDLADLTDGATVVIFNKAHMKALSQTYNGYYNAGVDVALSEEGALSGFTATEVWTVGVNADDNTYTFSTAEGKKLSMADSRTSMPLDEANPDWMLTPVEGVEGAFYIENTVRTNARVEWYDSNNNWSAYYNNNDGELFQQYFYLVDEIPETPVEPDDPTEETVYELLTEAPADGAKVVIHNTAANMVLTATASGNKLAGTPGTPADGKLTLTDDMAVLTVSYTDDGKLLFEHDGKYLTSTGTGNNLSFADADTGWTLGEDGGHVTLTSSVANYNGNYNQALEYYNGKFTTYGIKTNNAAYQFDFYGEPAAKSGVVTDLAQLTDGAKVVIFNKANLMALSSTYAGNYNAGVAVTLPDEGKLSGYGATEIWTVGVNASDNTYTFSTADGKKLSMDTQYSSMPLDKVNDAWTVTAVPGSTDGAFYIDNVGRSGYRMEWYADKGNWSSYYKNNDGELFQQYFYLVVDETPDTPVEPGEEKSYGLSSTLATGDKVILFNDGFDKAISSEVISNYYLGGKDFAPEAGVIKTADASVVWEVTVNNDGTYTFTQNGKTLGGTQSTNATSGKVYNNIALTGATATNWTAEAAGDGVHLYLADLPSSKNGGHIYIDWYSNYNEFSLVDYSNPGTNSAFIFTFYKEGAEPEEPAETGDLVTSLSQLTDGATVAIYSPGHKTAISTKPNGDWYLKANNATVENGKVVNFTSDFVWKVKVNEDGTYTFISNDDETKSITVWASGTYAEVTVDYEKYAESGDNTWKLDPAKTANCFYVSSPKVSGDRGAAYLEAYVRNEFEVFSGYFTNTSSYNFAEENFALQFYLVNPDDAVAAIDDGEWDGVLEKGKSYVAYNANAAASIGLWDEANYSMKAIPTTVSGNKATAGNGAYVFKIDTYGKYYSFEIDGKYLATNPAEELFFIEPNADGSAPESAKWFLVQKEGGYILYNKEVTYNGTPVCVEYYSSVFSGWTFSTKNDVGIYLFNFYEVADGTKVYGDVVQDPSVMFDCEDTRYFEQDYAAAFSLDDLAPEISTIAITAEFGNTTVNVEDYESSADGKSYTFTLPASVLDEGKTGRFTIRVKVTNSYGIEYEATKTVSNVDEPFFSDLTPAPNAQTGDDKTPVISAKIGNVGDAPTFRMLLTFADGEQEVEAVYENGVLSYQPAEAMADGRVTVKIEVTRADGVSAEKAWSFTVGKAGYQLYFGQLHSHTTYSDGSGSLETALDYIASLPESANVDFVAFTDHSNYFDTTSAANPADALNDKSLMTDASRALWETYKGTVADFNANHNDLIAIAGYEMTWSGGPGHINTYDSDGLVSRNNAALNNKTGDAGMKLYYETINKGESLNQFNHPGTTFGNFTDFSYWDEETDDHMFLVEVGNGEGQIGAGGYYPSYSEYDLALSKGWHIAPTNNQDNHKGRWGNANDARDVVLAESFSEQGIYDAIRNLRVYATEDKNLELVYTVNDMPMGTVFGEEKPTELNVSVTMYDPDATDAIQKVEVIADDGKVVYTWDNAVELAEGALSCTLAPEETYYYIRVTQKDGDLAVTAPVWVGNGVSAGISDFTAASDVAVVNEEDVLTVSFFNNEDTDATVTSVVYTMDGETEIGRATVGYTVPANGTYDVNFNYVPTVAKRQTITVTAVMEIAGKAHTYTKDLILSVREHEGELEVTDIATVRANTEEGYEYAIEGVVTSNASGYDKDTAFFDCIYVQDATGGICCFPVSGEFKIGDKVHVEGYTDFYQGEPELQVTSIEVIGEGEVEPAEVTAAQINDFSVRGDLVTVKGTVDSFEVVNGLIQTIMVKDANGDLCRVFIDGYITTGKEVEGCEVGVEISATGLASSDDTWPDTDYFARIRIRDRADIVCGSTEPDWAEPTWEWTESEDGYTATATFVDKNGGEPFVAEAEISVETSKATCEDDGETVYTATVTGPDGETYSDSRTEVIPADGHKWGEPTWSWNGATATATFVCEKDANHVKTVSAEAETEVTVKPTCTEDGEMTLTATVTGPDGKTYTATTTEPIAATGHHYGDDGVCVDCGESEGGAESSGPCPYCGETHDRSTISGWWTELLHHILYIINRIFLWWSAIAK